jgi:hypothetical protein
MPKIDKSIVVGKLSGMLGKEIVFRNWAGKTIVAKAPGSRTKPATPSQELIQEKFLLGSQYAKAVQQNADLAAGYAQACKPRQNVYSRALEDFTKPPVVRSINAKGYSGKASDTLLIRATDDFRVVSVSVEIFNADGSLVEKGNAVINANGIDWTYTTSQPNGNLAGTRIIAMATDVPGNEGSMELSL